MRIKLAIVPLITFFIITTQKDILLNHFHESHTINSPSSYPANSDPVDSNPAQAITATHPFPGVIELAWEGPADKQYTVKFYDQVRYGLKRPTARIFDQRISSHFYLSFPLTTRRQIQGVGGRCTNCKRGYYI
jgi:hypothetical protein